MAGITISVRSDGSLAVIESLPPQGLAGYPICMDDVMAALSLQKVVSGILTFEIEEAIRKALESGQPVGGVIAARALVEKELFYYGCREKIPSRQLADKVSAARYSYQLLTGPAAGKVASGYTDFVKAGERIFLINMQDSEDVFGRPVRDLPLPVNLHKGANVSESSCDGSILYTAEKSGYLVVDEEMNLRVFEPLITSEDRLKQFFAVLPVKQERLRELLTLLQEAHEEKQMLGLILTDLNDDMRQVIELQERHECRNLLYCQGITPVQGQPGSLHYCIDLHKKPVADAEGKMDMHEFSPFCVVQEGEKVAEYYHAVQGAPGKDVFGAEIPAQLGKELEISFGNNLKISPGIECNVIIASTAGILKASDTFVEVSESLVIAGDFGPTTGNLQFDKNVIVTGDIKGGYQLESGGDITVRGSIEAGARVLCGGNLTVFKGVFGRESQIIARGRADVGYVHEGRLQAGGDINVYKYISDSLVKCRGSIRVVGQGVKGLERGAVMGGEVYCLGSAWFHSVGTKVTPTKLGCGFDPDLYRQLKQCRAAVSAVVTRVLELQRSIGMGLRRPQTAQMIKRMSPAQKKELAHTLEEIKDLLARRQKLEDKRVELERLAFAPNLEMVAITIERHLVPKVTFVVGESVHIETNYLSNFSIRKGRHGVYINSLAKSQKDERMV